MDEKVKLMKNFHQLSILDYRIKYQTVAMILLILLSILIVAISTMAQTVEGNVVKVFDGDTVQFRRSNGNYYRVRLQGIDAPETRQTAGVECKQLLYNKVAGKRIVIMFYGADAYKRMLGCLFTMEGEDINLYMIQNGCAWEYSAPVMKKTMYQDAEQTARAAPIGLWLDSCPTEPWAFRASGYKSCL